MKLVRVEASIHNKNSTLSFGYIVKGEFNELDDLISIDKNIGNTDGVIAGVQLEGSQFRRFVISKDSLNKIEKCKQLGFFDKSLPLRNREFKGDSRKKEGFCKYGDNFRYKYIDVEKEISFEVAYGFIVETFEIVKKIKSHL